MSDNFDTLKVRHIDKLILQKYIKEDFLEENTDVFSATFPELINFLIRHYLKENYDKLKSEVENELKIKHIKSIK